MRVECAPHFEGNITLVGLLPLFAQLLILVLCCIYFGFLHKPDSPFPCPIHHETHDPENIFDARVRKGYSQVDMIAWIGFVSGGPLDIDWSMSRPRPWNFNLPMRRGLFVQ
jgi:hypothetical protein